MRKHGPFFGKDTLKLIGWLIYRKAKKHPGLIKSDQSWNYKGYRITLNVVPKP